MALEQQRRDFLVNLRAAAAKPVIQRPDRQQGLPVAPVKVQATSSRSDAPKSERQLFLELHKILTFLKKAESGRVEANPQTIDEIYQGTGIKLDKDNDLQLWERLSTNPKIVFDDHNKTFQYQAKFNVRTKEDLLLHLHGLWMENTGLDLKKADTKDSFIDIKAAARELEAEGKAFIVRSKDNKQELSVFYNDSRYNTSVDEEFRKAWHDEKLPEFGDLARQLEAKGHHVTKDINKPKQKPQAKPTKRRAGGSRTAKLTNIHMLDYGIDFRKDFMSTTEK